MRRHDAALARQRTRLLELQGDSEVVRRRRRLLLEWLADRSDSAGVSGTAHEPSTGNEGKHQQPCCCGGDTEQPPMVLLENEAGGDPVPVVAGEVLASGDAAATPEEALRAIRTFGFDGVSVRAPGGDGTAVLQFTARRPDGANITAAIDTLERLGFTAGPNHFFPLAWSVKGKVGPEGTCDELAPLPPDRKLSGIVVVVDTGLASQHARDRTDGRLDLPPDAFDLDPLDQRDAAGNDTPDGCLDLGAGHGTSVAGVVEDSDDCLTLRVLRAIGPDGVGDELRLAAKIAEALDIIDAAGGRGVVNLSLGTQTLDDRPPIGLQPVLARLADRDGICVVAAAGNSGTDQPVWPAAFDGVIAVAGLGADGKPAPWSSRGDWVDFSAAAEGIVAPFVVGKETPGSEAPDNPFDPYPDVWDGPDPNAMWTGTSFAAPRVSAWLARYLAAYPDSGCRDACAALTELAAGTAAGYGALLPDPLPPVG